MIKCQTHVGSSLQDAAQIRVAITATTYTRLFEAMTELSQLTFMFLGVLQRLYGILQLQKKINKRRDFLQWWTKWLIKHLLGLKLSPPMIYICSVWTYLWYVICRGGIICDVLYVTFSHTGVDPTFDRNTLMWEDVVYNVL